MINFDNIVSAHFKNKDYTVIEVLYKKPNSYKTYAGFFDITEQPKLLEKLYSAGFNKEKLIENTVEYKRSQSIHYNKIIQKKANEFFHFKSENLKEWENGLREWERGLKEHSKNIDDWDNKLKTWESNIEEKELTLDQILAKESKQSVSIDFTAIYNKNWAAEEIFKTKLWALELDDVRQSDKALKSRIRKASSIMSIFGILSEILKEKE